MKKLGHILLILAIAINSWAQNTAETPSTLDDADIIPAPEVEVSKPYVEPEPIPEPTPTSTPVPTPTPSPTPETVLKTVDLPHDKVQDDIAKEHDLWDPDFLLQVEERKEEADDPTKSYFERSYLGISRRVVRLANSVDSIFGDQRAVDEYDGSTLRITQNALLSESGFSTQDLQLSLNLQLPNLHDLEKRAKAAITSDSVDEGESQEQVSEEFKKQNPWEFRHESGVRTRWPASYFTQVRARRNYLTMAVVHHLLLQLGWDSETEWEQKTSLSSDYAINRDFLFRFLNEANWAMTNHLFGTIHGPSVIQKIDDSSAISYDARFTTKFEGDDWYINNYTLGSTYRKAFWGRRFFFELKPEMSWPKWDRHGFNWNIYMSFELLFGRAS